MNGDIVKEKQDLTYLSWTRTRNSSGTAGSFLKAYSELGGEKIYYKLSNYDSMRGAIGHECVNELIVDRLLTILGVGHLHYQLIHADILVNEQQQEVYLSAFRDFKKRGESKIALDVYYDSEHREGETPLEFCVRNGWADYIYTMFVVDYLILNRDRHGANIEVLRDSRKRTIRLAPLFDHGLSLLFNCLTDESIREYDVMEDRLTNTFIGSRSTMENLKLIPAGRFPKLNPLLPQHRDTLMQGLEDVIPQNLRDKIWEMIWKRWCVYEDICNPG
ncbi:MAG: hypothetical protein LUI14_06690 [Lachnospiraceae bacterium]|nr:hypothetical protein [Lachnospiraceae bacterium]